MRVSEGDDLDEAVTQVLESLLEIPGVRHAGLALAEGGGRRLRVAVGERDTAPVAAGAKLGWEHVDAYDDVPLTTVLRTGEGVVGALELLDPRHAAFVAGQRGTGIVAVAVLPLTTGGSTWGGLDLRYDDPQRFGPHQLDVLRSHAASAAHRIGVARKLVTPFLPNLDRGVGQPGHAVRLDLAPSPSSPGVARRFARGQLARWGIDSDTTDTAVLCLSELVTNVVLHTASRCHIELCRRRERLVVTVRDGGGGVAGEATDAADDSLRVHGRGLQLIEALADDWGADSGKDGMTVWCSFVTGGAQT